MREFTCKDCQREIDALERELSALGDVGTAGKRRRKLAAELTLRRSRATYNENWARGLLERGGSRSDRCKEHRERHRVNIQGVAVAYIDLETVGEVADRSSPGGPLGGLGPLPTVHELVEASYNLENVRVGMTDEDIVEMIDLLRDKRVLILKAGTGTGKSTFAPYRLMDPPEKSQRGLPPGAPFTRLTELGPIVVTEPRVQAAVGVATFVGTVMSGTGGVGPGFPVGYQVSGDRAHDEACELVYVTDGTMINWMREGRLSRIGTVIVDEAHERNINIDFIMGYLRRELDRYPHLRVIITSATFNTDFYQEFFGGPEVAHVLEVAAEKSFGYGMPLFPNLDCAEDGEPDVLGRWHDDSLPLSAAESPDERLFVRRHWHTRYAPPLTVDDVANPADAGYVEDVWATTAQLLDLRYRGRVPAEQWRDRMPQEMTEFVVQLAEGLDERGIFGDILCFLPTRRTIEPVCGEIEQRLGPAYAGHVFPLVSALPKDRQRQALARRQAGDPRKIVISTNLAETSLTVEGVRFVVDSGVIAQSAWNPDLAKGGVPTVPHSQAGIKQRWGRVGRKAPGWVFPLYTKGQYLDLAEDTPPESARENLEALVMTARMGGVDDLLDFPWPAAFQPTTTELDASARATLATFSRELARADAALRAGGAVDGDGHPTSFGRELHRFQGLGSTQSALAILYADRLACVPEVATILALLEDARLDGPHGLLQDDPEWPDEWRLEAYQRHRGLAAVCADEAELVLLVAAAWERADPEAAPWADSEGRRAWARQWWVDHDLLLAAARRRQEVLGALSPAMKAEVKRFLEPALVDRACGVITRALAGHRFRRTGEGVYQPAHPLDPAGAEAVFGLEASATIVPAAVDVIALRRRDARDGNRVSNLVAARRWALADDGDAQPTGAADAMRLVLAAARHAPALPERDRVLSLIASWPIGQRVRMTVDDGTITSVLETLDPFSRPVLGVGRGRHRGRAKANQADDRPEATREDNRGELALPRRQGASDEDTTAARAFERADREVGLAGSCGACRFCLAGQEASCQRRNTRWQGAGHREDPVRRWLAAARAGVDVSAPRIELDDAAAPDPEPGRGWGEEQWYEVAGYQRSGDDMLVVVRRDWRSGVQGDPARHDGVNAGDPIEVVVGAVLRHHGGPLRAFARADGRGRFVLAEASSYRAEIQEKRGEIAASLDRGCTALLAELVEGATLTATVVPARAPGCVTITLLELLSQHLDRAVPGTGVQFEILDPRRRNAARTKLHTAVIETPPNEHGYATAVLLHQDGAKGIRHRFTFNVRSRPAAPADEAGPEAAQSPVAPVEPGIGEPRLLRLVQDRPRLLVGGLDLAVLEKLVRDSNRQLELADDDDADRDAVPALAPPRAALRTRSDRALSRSAAASLATLSDDPGWANEVWSFWARSHHLMVAANGGVRPGTRTEPVDVDAQVVLALETPAEQQRRLATRFAADHPVGSVVDATVVRLMDRGALIDFGSGLEGLVPLAELSWERVDHASRVVTPGDQVRLVVTRLPEPPAQIELSLRALTPNPITIYTARYPVDSVVFGEVRSVTKRLVFVDLAPGVVGTIHVSELSHDRVEDANDVIGEGIAVRSKIIDYDQGRGQVRLSVKRLQPEPFEAYRADHKIGDTVHGRVRNATANRVFVVLDNGVIGVIYVRDLVHQEITDAAAMVQAEMLISARIIGFDEVRKQVKLSRKALLPKPFAQFKATHRIGESVDGTVSGMNRSFAYVDLPDGVDGAIHVGQLSDQRIGHPSEVVTAGQRLRFVIIGFNDAREQVELSLRRNATAAAPAATAAAPLRRTAPPVPPPPPQHSSRAPGRRRSVTLQADTVDEAIDAACRRLGVRRHEVTWTVLDTGAPPGLIRRRRPAEVEVVVS